MMQMCQQGSNQGLNMCDHKTVLKIKNSLCNIFFMVYGDVFISVFLVYLEWQD